MAIEPINFDCKGNALGPEKGKFMVRLCGQVGSMNCNCFLIIIKQRSLLYSVPCERKKWSGDTSLLSGDSTF